MKTLEDFKNEVAVDDGYADFKELIYCKTKLGISDAQDRASILYAKYIQEETIKNIAETKSGDYPYEKENGKLTVLKDIVYTTKQSILNIERILK